MFAARRTYPEIDIKYGEAAKSVCVVRVIGGGLSKYWHVNIRVCSDADAIIEKVGIMAGMWNTLSAGFHIVQEKLDHVLDGDETGEEGEERAKPSSESTDGAVEGDVGVAQGHVTPVDQSDLQEPRDQMTPVQLDEVSSLRQALEMAEQQAQLINSEYGKLLREKELELDTLRSELALRAPLEQGQPLELVQKDLAVHKEMVAELREQLLEKETDIKDLNTKAETKFNKLKAQAKAKIAALNKELEKMKGERGDHPPLNVSAQSLDDSMSTSMVAGEVETLRSQLGERERTIAGLEEQCSSWQQERAELLQETSAMKDKLNVAEVCLEKERERCVGLELRLTELEDQLDSGTTELEAARTEMEQQQLELKSERESVQKLQAHVSELTARLEPQSGGGNGIQRNLSFTSSDMQVISEVDSEEEWKVVQSGSRNSPADKSTDSSPPPPPVEARQLKEAPMVLAVGERASLVDLESEVARLESSLQEREDKLSSFKSILEEKEMLLREQSGKEEKLTLEVNKLTKTTEALELEKSSEVEALRSQITESQDTLVAAQKQVEMLEKTNSDLTTENVTIAGNMTELKEQLQSLESQLQENRMARDNFEQELWNKMAEISKLSAQIESQQAVIVEEGDKALKQHSEVERLRLKIQELEAGNEALRANIDDDQQALAEKQATSLNQIQELEKRVCELETALQGKQGEISQLENLKQQLEQNLLVTQENVQQSASESQSKVKELQACLKQEKEESEKCRRILEEQLDAKTGEFQALLQQKEQQLSQVESELVGKQQEVARLKAEKDLAFQQITDLQSKLAKSSGALEFAQQQLGDRDTTITSLSQAVDEKKAIVSSMESEIARIKLESAEKLTEMMQRSEQTLQGKTAVESDLREVNLQLEGRERELAGLQESVQTLENERSSLVAQLETARAQLEAAEREKEARQVETETLRGEVEVFSEAKSNLMQEQTKRQEEILQLRGKVSESSIRVADLQQKLKTTKQQLSKVLKEGQEERSRYESREADLARYERENRQMKEQFDSAVKLMESKSAEQTSSLSRAKLEIGQKDAECVSLREQARNESRKSSELREKVTKLTADYKIASDRYRLLEQEKLQLQQKVSEVMAERSQLEQSFSGMLLEKESLSLEHEASLRGVQEHEARVMDLTNQVSQLAREKEGLEMQVREVSRQLSSSEQSRRQLSSELVGLRGQAREVESWQREKQTLHDSRASMERERTQLVSTQASLQAQVQQLQSSLSQAQQELQESHLELEACRRDSAKSALAEELQRKVGELEHTRLVEMEQLQRSLREERERREAAERALEELKGEVSIGMEDISLSPSPEGESNGERNMVHYFNIARTWVQRFIKNPNIVLTRLLRATPQTKLFFLAYFVLLHLLILVTIFT